jgi:hypothetical protein
MAMTIRVDPSEKLIARRPSSKQHLAQSGIWTQCLWSKKRRLSVEATPEPPCLDVGTTCHDPSGKKNVLTTMFPNLTLPNMSDICSLVGTSRE